MLRRFTCVVPQWSGCKYYDSFSLPVGTSGAPKPVQRSGEGWVWKHWRCHATWKWRLAIHVKPGRAHLILRRRRRWKSEAQNHNDFQSRRLWLEIRTWPGPRGFPEAAVEETRSPENPHAWTRPSWVIWPGPPISGAELRSP